MFTSSRSLKSCPLWSSFKHIRQIRAPHPSQNRFCSLLCVVHRALFSGLLWMYARIYILEGKLSSPSGAKWFAPHCGQSRLNLWSSFWVIHPSHAVWEQGKILGQCSPFSLYFSEHTMQQVTWSPLSAMFGMWRKLQDKEKENVKRKGHTVEMRGHSWGLSLPVVSNKYKGRVDCWNHWFSKYFDTNLLSVLLQGCNFVKEMLYR